MVLGALAILAVTAAPAAADHCLVAGCHQGEAPPSQGSPPPSQQPAPAPQPSAAPSAADQLARLLNEERARHGLAPFQLHGDAASIAAAHSLDMARTRTLRHNDAYFSDATRSRLGADRLAENVAMNPDVADAHRRLMASPGHRANILDPALTHVGVGAADDGDGTYYFTEAFFTPRAAAPAPAPAPAPVSARSVTATPGAPAPASAPTPTADASVPGSDPAPSTEAADSAHGSDHVAGAAMIDGAKTAALASSPRGILSLALLVFTGVAASALRLIPRMATPRTD